VKPEIVEEGGNWYRNEGGAVITQASLTDVALAANDYAVTGRLVKFGSGTSWAAPKVAHLAARIANNFQIRNADLLRALIVNSARWPATVGSTEQQLRLFGYGVPRNDRALDIGGARCVLFIEDSIRIGNVHFYRIPWPQDLFDAAPEADISASITLAYRAPVRKSNRRYRGTAIEWRLSKRGESFQEFHNRSAYQGVATPDDDDEGEDGEQPIADWPWVVRTNLRKRGTVQKDWFTAPASYFGAELFLSVIGRRGWLSKQQQDDGFLQRYAIAITLEASEPVQIYERIAELIAVPVDVAV
jgi:hypothetical protein